MNGATLKIVDHTDRTQGKIELTLQRRTVTLNVSEDVAEAPEVTVSAQVAGGKRFADDKTLTVVVGKEDSDTATEGEDYTAVADQTLTIDAESGNGEVTFTFTPTNDDIDEDNEEATVDVKGDLLVDIVDAAVIITDNDTRGVTVPKSPVTVAESGEDNTADYTVELDSEPTDDVTVTVTSGDTDAAKVSVGEGTPGETVTLTFTAANWNTPQTVKVTGVKDDVYNQDGQRTANISHSVSGGDYGAKGVTADPVTVKVSDQNKPSIALSLSQLTVAEEIGSAPEITVTATVSGDPFAGNRTLTVAVGASSDTAIEGTDYAEVTDFGITIAKGETTATGTFTLDPTDDEVDESDETVSVGGTLSGVTVDAARLEIIDNDTAGIALSKTTLAVDEDAGTATYTVALATKPTADVAVTVSSEDYDAAKVSVGEGTPGETVTLTFTAANWNTPQTVKVTGVNDDIDDASDRTATISHKAGNTGGYTGVTKDLTVTLTDDDEAGIVLDPTTLTVDEDAGTATYEVKLSSEPTAAVTVTVTSGDTDAATVSPASLTFEVDDTNSKKWDTDQTVTVTLKDDDIDNATDRTATISHSANDAGGYDDVEKNLRVTLTDDDTKGVSFSKSSVTVAEAGGRASYDVVLDSEPTGTVTMTVTSGDTDVATVSPASLTFEPDDTNNKKWDDKQTVTVTGVDDAVDNPSDRTTNMTHTVSGADYGSVTAAGVAVTVTDDETKGIVLTPASLTEDEDAGTATYKVKLASEPTGTVTVSVTSGATASATVSPASLTFEVDDTNGKKWDTDQTVTVTLKDDKIDNATDRTATISHSANDAGGYTGVTKDLEVTLTDDDTKGVTVSETELTVAEAGTGNTATYTVVLDSEPTGTVTVAVASDAPANATVSPASLEFEVDDTNSKKWDDPQTVTVTGVDDDIDNAGDKREVTISHTVKGGDYEDFLAGSVAVDVTDDDDAPTAITLKVDTDGDTSGDQDTVAENASATTVTVTATVGGTTRFATEQTVTVQVGKSGDKAAEGTDYATVGDVSLTIAAGAASGTATFSLDPTEDVLDEKDETLSVEGTLAGVAVTGDTITITDNDAAPTGITLKVDTDGTNNGDQNTVAEGGGAKTVTVTATVGGPTRFATEQTVTVKVGKSSDTAVEGTDYTTVADITLTIDAGAASGTETFTLTPTDDALDEANETLSVEGTLAGVTVTGTAITITDNDGAPSAITLKVDTDSSTSGDQDEVAEGAGATTVKVTATVGGTTRFATEQTVTVKVGKSGDAAVEGTDYTTVADITLTIDAGAASGTETFTLTPTDDVLDEANETLSVEGSHTNSAINITGTAITITDNDAAPTGITLKVDTDSGTSGDQNTVAESADATTVTVTATVGGDTRFATEQTVTVKIGKDSDAATEGTDYATVGDVTLKIAAGAASGTKTFSLDPTEDTAHEGSETLSVDGTHTNSAITITGDTVTITDNDGAPTAITLTVDTDSVTEDADATTVTVTATVGGETTFGAEQMVTVQVGKSGDAAVEGTDYATVADVTLTIPANTATATATFSLDPTQDVLDEADETLSVEGTHTNSAITVTGTTVTITDDDDAPTGITLKVDTDSATSGDQYTVAESADATTVTVTATVGGTTRFAAAQTVTVKVGKSGDAAVEGTDYATVGDVSLTIAAGAASGTATFSLDPTEDVLDEADETLSVEGTLAGVTVTGTTVTITDNDAAPTGITLKVDTDGSTSGDQDEVGEDAAATTVTVTATVGGDTRFAAAQTVTVKVGKSGDAAVEGTDYATVGDVSLTIAAGAASGTATFSLDPTGDDLHETDETVSVDGTLTGVTVTGTTITITDAETRPTVTLALDKTSISENGEVSTVTATLSGKSSKALTLTVAAAPVSPAAAGDFTLSTNKTLTIAAESTTSTGTVTITANGNDVDAPDKTVTVSATASGGNGVGNPANRTLTITDDDSVTVSLVLGSTSISEDDGSTTVTATLSGKSSEAVTLTVGASPNSPAVAGDFTLSDDVELTIAAGATSSTGTVTITAKDNDVDAPDKTVTVSATASGGNGVSAPANQTLTITDNEGAPTVSLILEPSSISEDGGSTTVTATLSSTSSEALTLTVAAAPVSPAVSGDFTLSTNKTLTIAAGATTSTGTVTITAKDNDVDAPDKTVTVTATASGGNGVVAPDDQTLTITDDDTKGVTLSKTSVTVAESGSGNSTTYTVALDSQPTAAVTVTVASADDTAAKVHKSGGTTPVASVDLTFTTGNWDTAQTVTVTAVDDAFDNVGDKRETKITHTAGATGGYDGVTKDLPVRVNDDDGAAVINLSLNPTSVAEDAGSAQEITVTATIAGGTRYADAQTIAVKVGESGSATSGTDYEAVSDFNITIAANAASGSASFDITPTDDDVDEGASETVVSGVRTPHCVHER